MTSICVFCGSAPGDSEIYGTVALEVGAALAARRWRLVYGGSSVGLMDILSSTCLSHGGDVVGIITEQLMDLEVGKAELSDLRIVRTMAERKAIMFEESDAFLALPGGVGTMDELFEALAFSRLSLHDKPVGLLNVASFYDNLIAFLDQMYSKGFSPLPPHDTMIIADQVGDLLDRLAARIRT